MTRRNISTGRRALVDQLLDRVDSYEQHADGDAPMIQHASHASISPMAGNPPFDAQFDLQILTKYFTVAAGVYTVRTAAYVLATFAALATQLACFIFGITDFTAGYKKLRTQFPLSGGWAYENPFIYGNGYAVTSYGALDANAVAQLQVGDLVIPYTAIAAATNVVGLVIVRCSNVAYGTLLFASNSDRFVLNRIRYVQNDTSAAGLTQYNNAIYWFKQSLFGKFDQDSISPTSQKQPTQFQTGIIDLPITKEINKEVSFGSYINYDAVSLQWSIFVLQVRKLS